MKITHDKSCAESVLRAILLICLLVLLAVVSCGLSGCTDEPQPPFFGDYGNCLKQTPESQCTAWQYPNGDGPLFKEEWKQYKEEHAYWYEQQLRQSKTKRNIKE
jgi:hypothetical protein